MLLMLLWAKFGQIYHRLSVEIWLLTPLLYLFLQFSALSSFAEMSSALRLLSPENRTALPKESFKAFTRIMCGHPEIGGEHIPSLNWYEDNDIKSFLGKNGTEDTVLDHDNNTSKTVSRWEVWVCLFIHDTRK